MSGTGVLQNPEQVLTPNARERLKTVLASGNVLFEAGMAGDVHAWDDGLFLWYGSRLDEDERKKTMGRVTATRASAMSFSEVPA